MQLLNNTISFSIKCFLIFTCVVEYYPCNINYGFYILYIYNALMHSMKIYQISKRMYIVIGLLNNNNKFMLFSFCYKYNLINYISQYMNYMTLYLFK